MEPYQEAKANFIDRYWEVLGACAWKEYRAHGRGALVLGAFSEPDDAIYCPAEELQGHPLLTNFARFVDEYDPTEEVVVIFLWRPDEISAHRCGIPSRGTPPQLYEQLKGLLSLV
jgi:hypothetical protein